MKFARQYEPAILVYRQTKAPGSLLLRLGRIYDDGARELESDKKISKDFDFATHFVAKDTRGLLLRLQSRLSQFAHINDDSIDALSIDFPALKAEIEAGGNAALMADLETLWGAPALEAILGLPTLATRAERRRLAELHQKDDSTKKTKEAALPSWIGYAVSGFIAIFVLPTGMLAMLDPDRFEALVSQSESLLLDYAKTEVRSDRANAQDDVQLEREISQAEKARAAERLAFLEQIRSTKQALFIAANLGNLNADYTYTRTIPTGNALENLIAARETRRNTAETAVTEEDPGSDGTDTQEPRILSRPTEQVEVTAQYYGLPVDFAGFRLVDADTYRLDSLESGIPSFGVNAVYDLRTVRNIILQATPDDLDGLADGLDLAVAEACDAIGKTMNWTAFQDGIETESSIAMHPAEAAIVLEVGNSELAGLSISEDVCKAGSYDIFTLFEYKSPGLSR